MYPCRGRELKVNSRKRSDAALLAAPEERFGVAQRRLFASGTASAADRAERAPSPSPQSRSTDQPQSRRHPEVTSPSCEELALAPRILDRFADALESIGLVGEERAAKLLYLVLTTRFLPQPVSAVVKGPSSGGKSYVVATVLRFFPDNAHHDLTAMSERALAYSNESFKNRFIVVYEATGLRGDIASYLVRSLLSEG